MNTTTKQETETDVIPDKTNISRMLNSAWHVLSVGLYPGSVNNEAIQAMAKSFIKGFITKATDPYTGFAEFCQRIAMVRHYLHCQPEFEMRYSLMAWLDPGNPHGFAGSAKWFETLKDKRKQNPIHLLELKAFPEAILELAEEPSKEIFQYWNNWFIEKRADDLQVMLMLVAANLHYVEC